MSDAGTGQVPGPSPYQRGYRDGKAEADTRLRAANRDVVDMGLKAAQDWAEKEMRLRASNAELLAALERIAEASSERSDGIGSASILSGIARAAVAKAKAEPKLESQTYKIQPPTFVPKD